MTLRRSVSAAAISAALAIAGLAAPILSMPAAQAQDRSAEAELSRVLAAQGVPPGMISWSSVERRGATLVARGVHADLSQFDIGYPSMPLGTVEISDLAYDGDRITRSRLRFSDIALKLADVQAAGQAISKAATGKDAAVYTQYGTMLIMAAGYLQGMGYQMLDMTSELVSACDFDAGTGAVSLTFDVADMAEFEIGMGMSGITRAYYDWTRENTAAMYTDPARAQADLERATADPGSPASRSALTRLSVRFHDQGLMSKFAGLLGPARARALGTNPDGSARSDVSDESVQDAVAQIGQSMEMPAAKVAPLARALLTFLADPTDIAIAMNLTPAVTLYELRRMDGAQPSADAPAWASRITFEASN